jgi:hypothetical protein
VSVREVRGPDGILRGYQPIGRFIEVPYPSYPDWIGIVWRAGFALENPKPGARRPSNDAVQGSTGWVDFDAYQAKTGNTLCPAGKAWLGPDANDRLIFLTGVMVTPFSDIRRSRR